MEMASLNASKKSRFERRLREQWEREQSQKRIIEPEPLDAINEAISNSLVEGVGPIDVDFWKLPVDPSIYIPPYCKANCGARTRTESGYCPTCLDRMAVVGRVPEPKVKTPLVEMRPKRQIQLED